jgi:hypothetical protein
VMESLAPGSVERDPPGSSKHEGLYKRGSFPGR